MCLIDFCPEVAFTDPWKWTFITRYKSFYILLFIFYPNNDFLTTRRNYAYVTASVLYLTLGMKTAVCQNISTAFCNCFWYWRLLAQFPSQEFNNLWKSSTSSTRLRHLFHDSSPRQHILFFKFISMLPLDLSLGLSNFHLPLGILWD